MNARPYFTTTRTGIQIGRSYVPRRPLYSVTRSEEQVQRALLAKPPVPLRDRIAGVALAIAMALAVVALALHEMRALFIGA